MNAENALRAVTLIENALATFQRENGLTPRVILLPRHISEKYFREISTIEALLPDTSHLAQAPGDAAMWVDVRVVEHETIEDIEIY